MNKSLCVLICFLVGILVYSLIRSYCNCGVVEGAFTKSSAQTAISGNMCHKNDTMCADIIDASRAINCPGHGSDVCGFNGGQWDELNGSGVLDCALGKKLTKAVKAKGCTSGDGADEINYLQWYIGCSGHQDFTCSGGESGGGTEDGCTGVDCGNNASCTVGALGTDYTCTCSTGYTGETTTNNPASCVATSTSDSYCKPSTSGTSDTTSPNPLKVLKNMRDSMQDKDFNNMDQETCCTDILTQANIETNKNQAGNMVKGSMCFLNNKMHGNPMVLNNFRKAMNESFPECGEGGEDYFTSTNVTSDCSE